MIQKELEVPHETNLCMAIGGKIIKLISESEDKRKLLLILTFSSELLSE